MDEHKEIIKILKNQDIPFYQDWGYWISIVIGIIGIYFSFVAFLEAREAKKAAKAAGNFVKIQSITIDLTEIIQRLDILSTELKYSHARDFFNELNRRLRRIMAILSSNDLYKEKTAEIKVTLDSIKANLDGIRQSKSDDQSTLAGINIYYAVESEFSTLSGQLADLSGLLEQKTIE